MKSWINCKNILCIRPDNMGDLIMSGPAIRALKQSFGCKITVLTSSMAAGIAPHMPEIDDIIIFDLPWVKTNNEGGTLTAIIEEIKSKNFDAAVIFTVYSQSALPSATLAYQAGIAKVLAYCRENPYGLISHWVPDEEPYELIKHQVQRDLDLVHSVGAEVADDKLHLSRNDDLWYNTVLYKLNHLGFNAEKPWLILHAGVSEKKREYPNNNWISLASKLLGQGYQILFTGSASEKSLTDDLQAAAGRAGYSLGGVLSLDEFICLIGHTPAVISVNTGTVHIAAAVGTPVVVLYAQSNPQHTPWKVANKVLPYSIPEDLRSKNEVIAWVGEKLYSSYIPVPTADEVVKATQDLLSFQLREGNIVNC
jgi:lipopolysaccharide heptosyltransferase II